ncbi:T6SS immunity protein Tdi1 domain-containing protein [Myroides sp. LJL110]
MKLCTQPKIGRVFFILSHNIVIDNIGGLLNIFIEYGIEDKDYFNSKEYVKVKNKLPKLKYGECYGYVPALVLGGEKSIENIKIVDTKAYITIIGEARGKIFEYGNN